MFNSNSSLLNTVFHWWPKILACLYSLLWVTPHCKLIHQEGRCWLTLQATEDVSYFLRQDLSGWKVWMQGSFHSLGFQGQCPKAVYMHVNFQKKITKPPFSQWTANSSTLATWCKELTYWKRSWCWERLKVGGEGDDREWDGWMTSPAQWTCVWISSGSWWWTGRPGMLQSMGLQRVGHAWAT